MANTTRRRAAATNSSRNSVFDGDGNQIHTELLLSLPQVETEAIFPTLEFVRLNTHHLLHEPGDTLRSAYFCNHGMMSILTVLTNGKSVGVGLVGKEGFVGLPLVAGYRSAADRAIVQSEATAFRVNAETLTVLLRTCPVLERKLQQFGLVMAMDATQIAACNQIHEVEQRVVRWLLMCSDRVGSTSLPLTHELLSQILGTRRSSITSTAGRLRDAGIIRYSRGMVDILRVAMLQKFGCECYGAMRQQRQRWNSEYAGFTGG